MNKKYLLYLAIASTTLFGCKKEESGCFSLAKDGTVTVSKIDEFAFETNKYGEEIENSGKIVTLENAKLKLIKTSDESYKMEVFPNDGYDLDQFIINDNVTKYTDLDSAYSKVNGKSYYLDGVKPLEDGSLKLKARIAKQKTKKDLSKDASLAAKLNGLKYSILGDSISTYSDYNNNVNYNTTLSANWVYYPHGNITDMSMTYWGLMLDDFGMDLCVNNSSSGSFVYACSQSITQTACLDRCLNLHSDVNSTEPDIITVYLGINDHGDYCSSRAGKTIGEFNSISDIKDEGGEYKVDAKNTFVTGYAMMIDKIVNRYPNAKVYVSNLLPSYWHNTQLDLEDLDTYNSNIRKIAKFYNIGFVNMNVDFKEDLTTLQQYYEDTMIHPNAKGMKRMADVFENAIIKDLTYVA